MPVEFLSAEQKAQYGQFCGEPNEVQLARYFHLDATDLDFILKRRGNQNRLGFALQITSVRFLGSFLPHFESLPNNVLLFVARQLSIENVSVIEEYAQRETTKREHTALIRQYYSYHEFNDSPWAFKLSRLLFARAWVNNERPSLMFDFATSWLIQNKVLLPGVTTLVRLIRIVEFEKFLKRSLVANHCLLFPHSTQEHKQMLEQAQIDLNPSECVICVSDRLFWPFPKCL